LPSQKTKKIWVEKNGGRGEIHNAIKKNARKKECYILRHPRLPLMEGREVTVDILPNLRNTEKTPRGEKAIGHSGGRKKLHVPSTLSENER